MIKKIPARAEVKIFVCNNCQREENTYGATHYGDWDRPSGWSVLTYDTGVKITPGGKILGKNQQPAS